MSDATSPMAALAARRAELVAQCGAQRAELAADSAALRAIASPASIGQRLNQFGKLPLAVAGVVLGLLITRPARAAALLRSAISLWPLVSRGLSLLQRLRAREPS